MPDAFRAVRVSRSPCGTSPAFRPERISCLGLAGHQVMPMKLALLLCALLFLPSALGAVMISQVLYDPLGTESGGEAVELYNSAGTTVNLSGWWLATDASARDVAFPAGAELSPRGFYLVADAGWARLRDNLTWQTADFEETMTLGNANSGLALYSPLGREDAAGWGNPMDAEMYEGTAAAAAAPGMSLRRRAFADTDDNAADFFESYPLWSAAPGTGHIILLEITVEENAPAIGSVMLLTDDLSAAGIQLAPVPGGNALLQVRANISGAMVVRAVLGNIGRADRERDAVRGNHRDSPLAGPGELHPAGRGDQPCEPYCYRCRFIRVPGVACDGGGCGRAEWLRTGGPVPIDAREADPAEQREHSAGPAHQRDAARGRCRLHPAVRGGLHHRRALWNPGGGAVAPSLTAARGNGCARSHG